MNNDNDDAGGRPFPRAVPSLCFKARLNAEPSDLKANSYSDANETRFHKNGLALSFVLKVRVFAGLIMASYDDVRAQFAASFFCSKYSLEGVT